MFKVTRSPQHRNVCQHHVKQKLAQNYSNVRTVAAGGGRGGGHLPLAALSRGRHFEGRKYGILKIGRFWQIDVCIAEQVGS